MSKFFAVCLCVHFEPFWQCEIRLGFSHGGLEIDLAVMRERVDVHGGGVSAFSSGRG